jgi:hypothetical protein
MVDGTDHSKCGQKVGPREVNFWFCVLFPDGNIAAYFMNWQCLVLRVFQTRDTPLGLEARQIL